LFFFKLKKFEANYSIFKYYVRKKFFIIIFILNNKNKNQVY
jgi:hypothetical protein